MAFNEQSGLSVEGVVHNTMNETVDGIKTFTSDPIIPDEAYGPSWNGSLEPPTKNALYDIIETVAADADVVHTTGAEAIGGVKTFSSDPIIPDEVYGVSWNGSLEPPTKNAIYDKIETVVSSIAGFANDSDVVHTTGAEAVAGVKTFSDDPIIPDEAYGPAWNGSLEPPTKNALYDIIETLGSDTGVVHLAGDENITGVKTFTVDPVIPDEAYGGSWNGTLEPPTKNAVYDKIQLLATDALVVHLAGAENITGVKTFTVDPIIPDEVYGGSWDGSLEPPTKNAIYDKLQTLAVDSGVVHTTGAEAVAGVKTFSSDPIIPDEAYSISWNGVLEPPTKNALYDKIETLAVDAGVVHTTGNEAIGGEKTFSTAPLVATEAYGAPWSGSLSVPTKDALYTKLEAILANLPEKQFYALLDQTGTSAPTLDEEHSNTLGSTPTYGRPSGAGTYTVTALNAFPLGRTNVQVSTSGKNASVTYEHTSVSVITIKVKQDASDVSLSDLVGKLSLAITVFPA